MADIHGICSDKFSGVREVFGRNLGIGADIGASVAVFSSTDQRSIDIVNAAYDALMSR
jgi:hypothetical protein